MNNKFSRKLSLYFGVTLLVFALVSGVLFTFLFRSHTLKLHKTELNERAESIASTLSDFISGNGSGIGGGMGGYGAYLRFIGDIAGTDVWIVDSELNLVTPGMGHGMMSGRYEYADLPPGAENLVKEVLSGKIAFSEDFSGLLSETTLTVGAPIKSGGNVLGVVLLHSPVHGTNEAIFSGLTMLGYSILAALALTFALSIFLAKRFTDPIISKEAVDALRMEKIRRDFVANISHELKTPVTVMRGSLEALVEKVVTAPELVEEYHRQMLTETVFLERLVGDLLDLSKLQNADFAIEKTEISLCECLDDCARSIAPIAASKNVMLSCAKDTEICDIKGDYGRIRQMLMIVLDNAVKFSPANTAVEVTLKDRILTVRDRGSGIAPEELPYIFDRFYKSRPEQNKTGAGLGLAIAKQIADRHGVKLTAGNDEGGGAVFTFKMP